jgi:hypothetical protein
MLIFELNYPGTWLKHEDPKLSFEIQNLLQHLESQFYEANIALNLFLQSQRERQQELRMENTVADFQKRTESRRRIATALGIDAEDWQTRDHEVDVHMKREKWLSGAPPREHEHLKVFIYAKAFLYALDGFDKFLGVISKEPGIPAGVVEAAGRVTEFFPHLRGVRNTAQHLEDRTRGLDQRKKKIDLMPVENGAFSAPSGGLFLNCLNGTQYGSTMSNGHYGEVDVSPDSMQKLQNLMQDVINAFNWTGPRSHKPS